MIKKQLGDILPGQMSIFDFDLSKPKEIKQEIKPVLKTKAPNEKKFAEIINLYKSTAARIVKQVCGALLVELDDKTLYFNKNGINELVLKKDIALLPSDEILIVNQDKELNKLQLEKLKDMHVSKYIKRKGDANILISLPERTVVINPKGWILEYIQKPQYHENEIFITELATKNTNLANKVTEIDKNITESMNGSIQIENDETEEDDEFNFNVGDKVEFNYDGPQVGKITRIYNKGETVNVVWDHKHTAFYYKCVKKIS